MSWVGQLQTSRNSIEGICTIELAFVTFFKKMTNAQQMPGGGMGRLGIDRATSKGLLVSSCILVIADWERLFPDIDAIEENLCSRTGLEKQKSEYVTGQRWLRRHFMLVTHSSTVELKKTSVHEATEEWSWFWWRFDQKGESLKIGQTFSVH